MTTRAKFPERRRQRQADAAKRAAARADRSDAQQLARLDAGGFSAERERNRLQTATAAGTVKA